MISIYKQKNKKKKNKKPIRIVQLGIAANVQVWIANASKCLLSSCIIVAWSIETKLNILIESEKKKERILK